MLIIKYIKFNQFYQEKNVFTALAVVAFSGVAMANTVEVEKELVDIVKFEEGGDATPCQNMMLDIYDYTIDTYNGGGDDIDLLNALLSNCK